MMGEHSLLTGIWHGDPTLSEACDSFVKVR